MSTEYVGRTVGFVTEFEFVGEVTQPVLGGGFVVVREFGHTAWVALARARATAATKLHARRRRAGFYPGGFEFLPETKTPASFPFGFRAVGLDDEDATR